MELLNNDKEDTNNFSAVPFHYQQIATILLTGCVAARGTARLGERGLRVSLSLSRGVPCSMRDLFVSAQHPVLRLTGLLMWGLYDCVLSGERNPSQSLRLPHYGTPRGRKVPCQRRPLCTTRCFPTLPPHVHLRSAAEDIPDRDRVAELLDDIDRVRSAKLASTVKDALAEAATEQIPEVRAARGRRCKGWREGGGEAARSSAAVAHTAQPSPPPTHPPPPPPHHPHSSPSATHHTVAIWTHKCERARGQHAARRVLQVRAQRR